MRTFTPAALSLAIALAASAPPADAAAGSPVSSATALVESSATAGQMLYFTASGPQANNVEVFIGAGGVHVTDNGPITPGKGCVRVTDDHVSCNVIDITLSMQLGDGHDTLHSDVTYPTWVNGDAGDDRIWTGKGDDILSGAAGNDLLASGFGRDSLRGGDGNDQLDGGPGSDAVEDISDTDDTLSGGPGIDTADYSTHLAGVVISLEGEPEDGMWGERDDVLADVENVRGTRFADWLYGHSLANVLWGGLGNDRLYGLGGNDRLEARDGVVDQIVDCGTGTDSSVADASDPVTGCEARS